MRTQLIGSAGEDLAAEYLIGRGLQILARNYRSATGEIDLVARDGGAVVFVEVKRRTTDRYGTPAEAVTRPKQRKIAMTAVCFLKQYGLKDVPIRFDVLEIRGTEANWIPNAFGSNILY